MIWAAVIVGYILVGLFTARRIFTYEVKHDGYQTWSEQEDTHISMALGAVFWPIVPVILSVWGISKLLTAKPPESGFERRTRERLERSRAAEEKAKMQAKIASLEKELGMR